METLQYSSFHHVSFIPSDLACQHSTFMNPSSFNSIQPPSPMYEFSSNSPPSQEGSLSSPVTDISNCLNSIKVSSPQESPKSSPPSSPPRQIKTPRARRNLSLSMDNFVKNNNNNSDSSIHSSIIPSSTPTKIPTPRSKLSTSTSDETLFIPSPPSISSFITTLKNNNNNNNNINNNENDSPTENPCKSPKRARAEEEEKEREEQKRQNTSTNDVVLTMPVPHFPTILSYSNNPNTNINSHSQPLMRSASTSILSRDGKQRARSMLMKSESFVRRDPNSSCILPTIYGPHPDLQYVSPQTVVDMLDGKFKETVDEHHIIDCRFPYEYVGGHIKTAMNLTENEIKQMFIDSPRAGKKVVIIFHCEFSSQRAPRCLRFLRELDRKVNIAEYPKLTYPDVYVIEGGFKNFFETFENYCDGTYVEMRDERHFMEMKAHLRTFKRVRSMSADNGTIPFFQPSKFG